MKARILHGIDVSMWQETINLPQVKSDFVIIKATEGIGYTDPQFSRFAREVKGLRGFYHFARADRNPGTKGATGEAEYFVNTVRSHLTADTLLVLDWEAGSLAAGTGWAKTWLDEVHRLLGVRALVYTSSAVESAYDWSEIAPKHELWLANYGSDKRIDGYNPPAVPRTKHWGTPAIHQYSRYGRLPGYSGDLDLNASYIVASQWRGLAKGSTMSQPKMTSPAEGRVTSEFGPRAAIPGVAPAMFHAGIDITNAVGTPVYAAYAGTVQSAGENGVQGRTGKYVLISNPDGERQYYGHLDRVRVEAGQKVAQGQRIGDMGATGNVSGPHLHFEVWKNSDPNSVRNPRVDFNFHKVVPGSKPVGTSEAPKPPAPKPKPQPSKGNPPSGVQTALRKMGLPATKAGVQSYQKHHGLVADGDWGPVTQRYFEWVKKLQTKLNEWKAVQRLGRLVVDGYRGSKTVKAEDAVIALPVNRQVLKIRSKGTQVQKRADLYIGLGIGPVPPKRG